MADYRFEGLSAREFEHMVQALDVKVIAPGVRIDGDGKDGGREATFEGKMNYPSAAEPWDGYLIIQAKFLQRASHEPDQGRWALEQLKAELDAYAKPDSCRRKPDYDFFVTNAICTPVLDSGTFDKAIKLFDSYRDRIGYRGFDIWHFDTLRSHLDS